MRIGDLVTYTFADDQNIYEVTGLYGDELYDSRGFVSAQEGCTLVRAGDVQGPNDWIWTFKRELTVIHRGKPAWEV
ncbi:MAG: hypothetical protein ACW99G_05060 [Candidatus Thorarchaeota archaeon]|jgi:hypothetical protein